MSTNFWELLQQHQGDLTRSGRTVADYLVQHGVPFRDAHGIVGQIVIYCEDAQKGIEELSLDELLQFSPAFGPDIFSYIDYAAILQKGIKKEML